MKKLLLFLILLVPVNVFAIEGDAFNSIENKQSESISENSDDINVDKLEVQISDQLSVESGFGNNASSGNELIKSLEQLLKYVTFFIGLVAITVVIYLTTSMIFIQDENKIREYKKILINTIIGFLFYGFVAGGLYVWIIQTGKKYSTPYYNDVIEETLKDDQQLTPTLLK